MPLDKSSIQQQHSSSATTNDNSNNSDLPPPYTVTDHSRNSHTSYNDVPSYNPSCVSDAQPSAPSLYPSIPQQLPPVDQRVSFPTPQPYIHHPPPPGLYHPHSTTPLQPPYVSHYGSVRHSQPGGFHTIYIQQQQPIVHRRFPIGAIIFILGWFCPPFWVLGACCCASSSNPYEAWWARLNLTMALLLLFSSILYSMLAVVMGDWFFVQSFLFRQEI
ncbi:uncharacterized protein BX664DRAFT_325670 [Halteromyces radiatus]|uniref:uncharacterized protein n=1 Tax=Halteromyces radiatus TaxID=101107 RepID=UPI00221F78B1|nr:uncharacterized protein BX664DRAFT_325670 [Halteromyces radiatus]KAI8097154.1 hypothetical protein BX664DRAFT_325670 [Halteromyces radiatus]